MGELVDLARAVDGVAASYRSLGMPSMPLVTITAISMASTRVNTPPTSQISSMFRIEVKKLALPKI